MPNYAKIKIPNTSPEKRSPQRKTHNLRIKDEIKYLYTKNTSCLTHSIYPYNCIQKMGMAHFKRSTLGK